MDFLSAAPKTWPATGEVAEGVRGLFYEGLTYKGLPTRVFAWYGEPEHETGHSVPGMVLVHGGGGSAFAEWVRIWNRRGYAAIAMDLYGKTGVEDERVPRDTIPRHAWAGADHYGRPAESEEKAEDDWVYHAVGNIILAHSLLRSMDEVDPQRTGLTGISWGGFMACIVPAVDTRFQFSIPVYGCGFVAEAPRWQEGHWKRMGPEATKRWGEKWDPSHYIPNIPCPTLWVNGASDPHFTLNIHARSTALCSAPATLSIQPGLGHSHGYGWRPEEIYAFADSIGKNGTPLIAVSSNGHGPESAWARYEGEMKPVKAVLCWTGEPGDWLDVSWSQLDALLEQEDKRVKAKLPEGCRAFFINLTDGRGLTVSTPLTLME